MNLDDFWLFLDQLVAESRLIIDRPKSSSHPRFPDIIYPLDYGYLAGTTSGDRAGIDIWLGSNRSRDFSAVVVTVDLLKRDSEIKVLLGCNEAEVQSILAFHNQNSMRGILVRRPKEQS